MLQYLKYLFQLLLSPGLGWEDIEHTDPDPEELTRKGLYPHLGRLTENGRHDIRKASTLTVTGLGMMVLFQVFSNCLPWNLIFLKFLPIYVVLVLYKAAHYMNIRRNDEMRFLGITAGALVGVPLLIYYLLYFIIP